MKRAFTLIELLAVIIILTIIFTIGVPAIKNISDSSKEKTDSILKQQLVNAAKEYTNNYDKGLLNTLLEEGDVVYLDTNKLVENNLIDSNEYSIIKIELLEDDKLKYTPMNTEDGALVISFNAQGGTNLSFTNKSVIVGDTYGSLPTADKTNLALEGWYTEIEGGVKIEEDTIVSTENGYVFYAHYVPDKVMVTLNSSNGTINTLTGWTNGVDNKTSTKEYAAFSSYGELPTAVKNGYTFTGWYKETGLLNTVTESTRMISNYNHMLYSGFTSNLITIDYDEDGGDEIDNSTCNYDGDLVLYDTPLKEGYTFNSYQLKDGTYKKGTVEDGCINTYTGVYEGVSTDIKVVWCHNCDEVSNGTCSLNNNTLGTCSYITTCNSGYTLSNEGTYNPVCTPNVITLDYDENGGSEITSGTCTYDDDINLPAAPTKTNYTFNGWRLNDNSLNDELVTVTDGCTNDKLNTYTGTSTSIKAEWCHNCENISNGKCTLILGETCTYNTTCNSGYTIENDGEYNATCLSNLITINYNSDGGSTVSPSTCEYGKDLTVPTSPVKDGYTFAGWKLNDNTYINAGSTLTNGCTNDKTGKYEGSTELTGKWCLNCKSVDNGTCALTASNGTCTYNITCNPGYEVNNNGSIDATCTAKSYTVTFNPNGGTTSTTSKTVTYDETYGEMPTPTYTGHTFMGWYTQLSGGTKKEDTTTVKILDNETLYAIWDANKYAVTLNANNGTITATTGWTQNTTTTITKSITYATTYGELPDPVRSGYTFKGWFTDKTGGTQVISTSSMVTEESHVLYAHWEANTITLDWNENSGSTVTSGSCTYDQTLTLPAASTRSGYTFNGWKLANGTYKDASSTVASGCTNTYIGAYSGTSTSITAAWCNNCIDVSNGTCNLDAKTAGKCTYTTSCNTGYTQTNAGTYNPECSANTIDVDYNENEGTALTNGSCTYDSTLTLATPTRSGYVFNGWKLYDGTLKAAGSTVSCIEGNLGVSSGTSTAVTAQWCQACSGMTNGTCNLDATTKLGTCTYTTTCNTGYTIENNGKYNATCNPNTLTINFNENNGTSVSDNTCTYNSTLTLAEAPTRSNYRFNGWKLANGTYAKAGSTVANGCTNTYTGVSSGTSTSITAAWCEECSGMTNGTCELNTDTLGTCKYTTTCNDGYTIQNNGLYNATCNANTITIDYQENGGNALTNTSCTYNSDLTLSTPTRDGYTFAGWKLANNTYVTETVTSGCTSTYTGVTSGTSTSITATWCENCKTVANGTCKLTTSNGSCSYATSCNTGYTETNGGTVNSKCTAKTFTLTANANGGTIPTTTGWTVASDSKTATKSVTYNQTYGTLPTPERSGYTFNGWFTASSGGTEKTSTTTVTITATETLYARWGAKRTL